MQAHLRSIVFEEEPTGELATLGSLVRREPVAIALDAPIAEAARLLAEQRVPALAVIDGDVLRGLVTRTDVLRAEAGARARDAMSGFIFALPTYASVEKAAALMAYEGVGQILVTGPDGDLVGMVSALDIARHYAIESGYLIDG